MMPTFGSQFHPLDESRLPPWRVDYKGNNGENDVLLSSLWDRDIYIFPEDSEQGKEWEDEQDYPEEGAATEDETSDIEESESSGTNIFSDGEVNEKNPE